MKLKVLKTTNLVRTLPILDTFEVDVRHLTRQEREALIQQCLTRRYVNGKLDDVVDEVLYARVASRAYIAASRGLTNSIIRQLGVALEEDIPVNGDGYIEHDAELIEGLFREAHGNKFAGPVMNFSAEMLAIVEMEQKKSGVGSSS